MVTKGQKKMVRDLTRVVEESPALQKALELIDIDRAGTREAALFIGLAMAVNSICPEVCREAMDILTRADETAGEPS